MHALDHQGYMPVAGLIGPPEYQVSATPQGVGDAQMRKYMYFRDSDGIIRPMILPAALAAYLGMGRSINASSLSDTSGKAGRVEPFICPSQDASTIKLGYVLWDSSNRILPMVYMSYVFNNAFLARRPLPWGGGFTPAGQVTQVRHPGEVFLFADGVPNTDGFDYIVERGNTPDVTLGNVYQQARSYGKYWYFDPLRHRRKINIVFVDGHAETFPLPSRDDGPELDSVGLTKGIYN